MNKFKLSKEEKKAIRKTVKEMKVKVTDEYLDTSIAKDLADSVYCERVKEFSNRLLYYFLVLHGKKNKDYLVKTIGDIAVDELNKNLYTKDNAQIKDNE